MPRMRVLSGDPAEIVPHAAQHGLDLGRGQLREREAEVAARALRGAGERSDPAPEPAAEPGGEVERQRASQREENRHDRRLCAVAPRRRSGDFPGFGQGDHGGLDSPAGAPPPPATSQDPMRRTIVMIGGCRIEHHRNCGFQSMSKASFVPLPDRGILAVSGPDRRPFLQGLVSNDVEKLAPRRAVYAAFLTAQGKYLHDFIMVEEGEAIWLDAEAARLPDLKRRLSMYRLRAKVELAERPELAVAAMFGEGALAALDLPDEAGAVRQEKGGVVL